MGFYSADHIDLHFLGTKKDQKIVNRRNDKKIYKIESPVVSGCGRRS